MPSKSSTPSDRRRGSRATTTSQKQKPKQPKPPAKATPSPATSTLREQEILTTFHKAFHHLFTPALPPLLQTVKQHLFNRDYASAFGTRQNLEAYVVRWSPARALCYREVLIEACGELFNLYGGEKVSGTTEVACIGGGAGAEVVAMAGAAKHFLPSLSHVENHDGASPMRKLHITAIDVADWGPILDALAATLPVPAANFSVSFVHRDVLSCLPLESTLVPPETRLVTVLFTLNELYAQSRALATQFLLSLAGIVRAGCLLLVLESAGSYSTVQVNGKTFPMGMLLDYTLLGGDGQGRGEWEKVVGDEARWYRVPAGLEYPLGLENMRYFIRVYRRV